MVRPKTVIAAAAIAALALALVLLLIEVRSPGGEVASVPAADDDRAAPVDAAASAPVEEPASEPDRSPAAITAGADSSPETPPKIFVRPVPGAQMPDEITADNLADIKIQRDAAPEGSESARVQSIRRLHRQRRYAEAVDEGLALLDDFPDNTAVRSTVVSIACVLRDAALAREHYAELPERLRPRARSRCEKYGVELEE